MNGTQDNINELIQIIEQQKFNYVIGIIKNVDNDKDKQKIEIFTNINENGLDKLLKVLKDHKKSLLNKIKPVIVSEPKEIKDDKSNLS